MIRRLGAAILLILTAPAVAEPPGVPLKDSVPHMTTTGVASAEVMPDEAELDFGIVEERRTGDEAADATAKAARAVIATLKASGVEAGDIRTAFSLAETVDVKKDEKGNVVSRTPRGYQANEDLTVRLHEVAKVGPIARDLVAKGANAFQRVTFSYSKERQKRRDLDAEAMRDALLQAKTYTDAVGLKLGRVLQIGEDGLIGSADLPSRRPPFTGAAGVVIPIEPGLQRLQEAVTVIWEIEGRAR